MQSSIQSLVEKQKKYFYTGDTKGIAFRKKQLQTLKDTIKKNEDEILDALKKDLGKGKHEAFLTEVGFLYSEIKDMMKNVDYWALPRKEKSPLTHIGSKSFVYKDPYGTVLILAPWNYPFQLALAPLVGAIGGGNTAIIKPSEMTPYTSMVIRDMIASVFPEEYIAVVEGDKEVAEELLNEPFNYIFFTGSTAVGKKVMAKAAEQLIPVTLELGGKSPAIVMEDANLKLSAKRIVWGKFINAGQTCVAPDYVLIHEKKRRKFLKYLIYYTKKLYGSEVRRKKPYPKIINTDHHRRLQGLLNKEKIFYGGNFDEDALFFEPTIMMDVTYEDKIMEEEIFGPILPLVTFSHAQEVIELVRRKPEPLALYLFTQSKDFEDLIIRNLSFGGGCVNDTIMHLATPYLPFGGVGQSGMGAYHGKNSFDTFTHEKSILKQVTAFDVPVRYQTSDSGISTLRKIWE